MWRCKTKDYQQVLVTLWLMETWQFIEEYKTKFKTGMELG